MYRRFWKKYPDLDEKTKQLFRNYLERTIKVEPEKSIENVEEYKKIIKFKSDYILKLENLDFIKSQIIFDANYELVKNTSNNFFWKQLEFYMVLTFQKILMLMKNLKNWKIV